MSRRGAVAWGLSLLLSALAAPAAADGANLTPENALDEEPAEVETTGHAPAGPSGIGVLVTAVLVLAGTVLLLRRHV